MPFAFVLTPDGQGLLLQGGADTVALAAGAAALAVCALAVALSGWLRGPVPLIVRLLFAAGSLLLLYLEPVVLLAGLGVVAVAVLALLVLPRPAPPATA